uniref:Zinc/iron permease n=1 Tax=Elaeophora elaphi TaxID=1147741 RepID=A0A0R3RZL9_9BILA
MADESVFKPESLFYGFTSISIISLLSLTGLIFLPIIKGKWRNRWMQMFIALAASTMSSDALLHILPQESEDEAFTSDDHSMLLKMTAVIGAVYILYMLEFISALPIWKRKTKTSKITMTTVLPQNGWSDRENESRNSIDNGHHGALSGIADEPVLMCGLKSAAFVIVFGDAIHNFIDGIAVGASFAISNQVGAATSIAVACHELPHELGHNFVLFKFQRIPGDFAVLIESGLSVPRAMILNFLSALTAFAGLFIGLAAIRVDSAVEILLAITAGMFLYVAWL